MSLDPLWALQLGPVRVNAIQVAIGTVVTVVVGAGLVWMQGVARRRLAAWWAARQDRRHADHATIGSGWWFGDLVGASTELLVCVRAAPSKTFPEPVRLAVERIARFVANAFGDLFPTTPEFSNPTEVVRYSRKDTGHPGVDQHVNVWASGLIEATVPIPRSENDAGEVLASLVEITRALLPAIRAIQHGGYEHIFGPHAEIPLGLDWEIKLSRELIGQPSTPWVDLVFPGRVPDGRGTNQRPPWPRPGFGHGRLQCVATTTGPADILLPALEDLIERSGYYGTTDALDDLRATIRQLAVEAAAPGAATPGVPLAWLRRGPLARWLGSTGL
jgi:hypothetical protein